MFGFTKRLPVSEAERLWVDKGFARLEKLLSREPLLRAQVVLPNESFFPDPYDGSKASVAAMAARIAEISGVSSDAFVVEIFAEGEEAWRRSIPLWNGKTNDAAGLYFHHTDEGRHTIGVHAKYLREPILLVATLAHELAHVLLLGGGLLDREAEDMEPLTDLATVYLGFGFFAASASFHFKQWSDGGLQGWSAQRIGYLSEQVLGYALARFCRERGEHKPMWVKTLPTNVRAYFKASAAWLQARSLQ